MKQNLFTLVLFFLLFPFTSSFSQDHRTTLDDIFKNRSEIYFTFQIFDRSEIEVITRIVSIDNVKGREVFAYANRKEFAQFFELGYPYTILQHPGTLLDESELTPGGRTRSPESTTTVWNFYPTYDQYVTYMTGFAADHPAICRLDTIGITTQGRLILAVKISDSVNVNRNKPEFLYTSSIHGDELTGFICMMHLIDSLLSNYGTVPRITDLVNNYQIYINPLANPDGTYHGGNNSVYGAQRYNGNNVDLNRNFPDPKAGPHPDSYPWQDETKAFMHYDTIHHFVMSANFHGGAEVLNYPWDTWSKHHPDDAWFQFICREYADTAHLHAPSGYLTDFDNGITNGYAWYTINGGRQDYTTYFHFGREVTMEISSTKLLAASQLLSFWNYNRRSMLNYIDECANGINGQVTDTLTGLPLKATVMITGHDADNSYETSNASNGWYFRPIVQGSWNLTFSCSGYVPETIHGVVVTNRNMKRLNVRMVPVNYGVSGLSSQSLPLSYPNPSNGSISILLPGPTAANVMYTLYDISGKEILSGSMNREGDRNLFRLELGNLQKGIYLLRVNTGQGIYQDKIILQ